MLRTRTIAEVALARNRWFTPHTWTNGIGLLANLHVAAGVGGGPFFEFPYDPPGWTPERRDAMLAEPIRPGPDGVLRVPAEPGLGIRLDDVAIRRFAA
jgi:L-alanine-DL-glutamate epimerase-like enolase superfamily enzyme